MSPSVALSLAATVALVVALLLPGCLAESGLLTYDAVRGQAYNVSFDGRSLLLNGERTIFLSGAVHYPRVTPAMWPALAATAKSFGLNMIETYAFWNVHEPVAGELQWQGSANLSAFVQVFADAGLFVTLRIGPYVCAEYDNGGLPSWLGFVPGLRFRECNQPWLDASRYWFRTVVSQLRQHFAANGGPIVLVLVENELDGASEDYVAWCSTIAHEELARALGPDNLPAVIMSTPSDFGQAAHDTISTCNAADCVAGNFLKTRGRNGRVLVDHPALLTELEGGYQTWGESVANVTSYFFGRAPEAVAYSVARWFSRGGSLVNLYMLYGGNNYGTIAGASVTTAYAQDAPLCPDLLPHEPVFSHLSRLHQVLARSASALLAHPAQLDHGKQLGNAALTGFDYGELVFLENDGDAADTVRWVDAEYSIGPRSILLVEPSTERVLFDSADLSGKTRGRRIITPVATGLHWDAWAEPLLPNETWSLPAVVRAAPAELVSLTAGLTDWVFYEANISLVCASVDARLRITASSSLAFVVWVDGQPVAAAEDHNHDAARVRIEHAMALNTDFLAVQPRALTILAVAIGGAPNFDFDANSTRMLRGIVGDVWLGDHNLTSQTWRMRPGLAGEHWRAAAGGRIPWAPVASRTTAAPGTWLRTRFSTPALPPVGDGACLLDLSGLGRGHAYINGHDAGRFWLIPRNDGSGQPSQRFYHVPPDWLLTDQLNTLVVFEDEGARNLSAVGIAVSTLEQPDVLQLGHARAVVPCEW